MNYSEVETKVREATNDDTWGPHGTLMTEIAKYTFTYEHYPEVMSMVWKRMFETKKNWRRMYKVNRCLFLQREAFAEPSGKVAIFTSAEWAHHKFWVSVN